jgi:hypothetical protein
MARRGAIHPRWEWSRWEASDIDVGPEGERTGVSESIEARERNSQALRHTSYPRRESNPHLRFRKPLFYPLNYGDDDLEIINGLNGDGQDSLRYAAIS